MPKFVVIDPSVQDFRGHFCEYAMRVLEAAEAEGYLPVLAANRRFQTPDGMDAKVYPMYRYTHFIQRTEPLLMRLLLPLRARLQKWVFRRKAVLLFSPLGVYWAGRHQLRQLLGHAEILRPAILLPLAAGLYLLKVLHRTWRLAKAVVPCHAYLKGLYHGLKDLGGAILTPFRLAIRPPDVALRCVAKWLQARAFGKDTLRLFGQLRLEEDDIVFIPTMGTAEMMGLLHYFRKDPGSKQATWHLLFRRSIYDGRIPDSDGQDEKLRLVRKALQHFQRRVSGQSVRFWTDTEELTEQYNRLGMARFRTVPIPVGLDYRKPASASDNHAPLLVTYLGDARSEKGYHYLPHLVQDVWPDYVRTGRVLFALQSNYNVPLGEPSAVVGRAQLEHFPAEKVRLIAEALPSDEYRELLLSSDIILIPYDQESYSARSSGILAESLAAGIPVIVPAGTWMSRQFVGETYRHHAALKRSMDTVAAYHGKQFAPCRSRTRRSAPSVDAGWVAGGNESQCSCTLTVPNASTHALLSFSLAGNQQRGPVKVRIVQSDSGNLHLDSRWYWVEEGADRGVCSVLTSLKKGVYNLSVAFRHSGDTTPVVLTDVGVDFLRPLDSFSRYPSGAVGLSYTHMEEIPDLLREMVDHYDHYLRTARSFAPAWFERHNAKRLVAILAGRSLTVCEEPNEVEVASCSCR